MWKQIDRSGLKIGDFVNYIPDDAADYVVNSNVSGYNQAGLKPTQTIKQEKSKYKWRISNINSDGSVDLIMVHKAGDSPWNLMGISSYFYLEGAVGYNNGVFLMNDMCAKLYSNKSLGITARALNIEDMKKYFNFETSSTYSKQFTGKTISYEDDDGNSYNIPCRYPALYEFESGSVIDGIPGNKYGISSYDSYYSSPTSERI